MIFSLSKQVLTAYLIASTCAFTGIAANETATHSEQSAASNQILTTTISDDSFAINTPWYHLTMTNSQFYWYYSTDSSDLKLDKTDENFEDNYLWCFVGNADTGYNIYNKAAGPQKPLSIVGSTVYLAESGTKIFLNEALDSSEGTTSKYYALTEENGVTKLSDVSGRVGVSTESSDNETLSITWAEQTYQIAPSTGTISRTDGKTTSSWKNLWTSDEIDGFTLSNNYNNLTTTTNGKNWRIATGKSNGSWDINVPTGRILSSYRLNAELETTGDDITITGNCGATALTLTTMKQTFSVDNINSLSAYNFTVTGNNNKCAEISDFYVVMRRGRIDRAESVDVFRCTVEDIDTAAYRIPAIACVENGKYKGRLVAVNDFRVYGIDDIGYGVRIDLHISTSDDNGKTWTKPTWALDASGNPVTKGEGTTEGEILEDLEDLTPREVNSNEHWKCAFGDACIVSDRESGKILMMSVGGPVGFFRSTRENPNQLVRWYSSDGGTTWTEPECITESFLSIFDNNCPWEYINGQFIGSGRMMQSHYIKKGEYYRIYAVCSVLTPIKNEDGDGDTANYVMYSDDFGKSWNILGSAQNPPVATGADEPKAEELPDGSVLLAARNQSGNRNFNIFRYTDIDAGQGIWEDYVTTTCGQGTIDACNGEIIILPAINNETSQQTYLALQSFPYGSSRKNVSIIYKSLNGYDDINKPNSFSTWEGRYQVTALGSAYSAICWQKDNTFGFLYEEETYDKKYNGTYVNLTLEAITEGKYSYCEDANGSVRQAITRNEIDGRLAAEVNGEKGQYVGQPSGYGNPGATAAAKTYTESPTYENYAIFNKAMIDGAEAATIPLINNGVYRIISAHNGKYDFTNDKYLASNGSNALISTEDVDNATEWLIYARDTESQSYILYNVGTKHFVANTPAIYTAIPLSTVANEAGLYAFSTSIEGFSNFSCTEPTDSSHPALHLNDSADIVPWTSVATASQWYLLYLRDGTAENPEDENNSVISIKVDNNKPIIYYDLIGRIVSNPTSGHIYITSDHRKVRF